jgi:hypothetical protein
MTLRGQRAERLFQVERVPRLQSIARQAEKRLPILDAADRCCTSHAARQSFRGTDRRATGHSRRSISPNAARPCIRRLSEADIIPAARFIRSWKRGSRASSSKPRSAPWIAAKRAAPPRAARRPAYGRRARPGVSSSRQGHAQPLSSHCAARRPCSARGSPRMVRAGGRERALRAPVSMARAGAQIKAATAPRSGPA